VLPAGWRASNTSKLAVKGTLTHPTPVLVAAPAEHPSALVTFTACRKLLMPQSRLVWCVPRSAAAPAMSHDAHAVKGSSTATQDHGQVRKAGPAAAAGEGPLAAPRSTKQAPGQLAAAPAEGMNHHLTAAQVCGCYHYPLPGVRALLNHAVCAYAHTCCTPCKTPNTKRHKPTRVRCQACRAAEITHVY
jgi:hypothetical protein